MVTFFSRRFSLYYIQVNQVPRGFHTISLLAVPSVRVCTRGCEAFVDPPPHRLTHFFLCYDNGFQRLRKMVTSKKNGGLKQAT